MSNENTKVHITAPGDPEAGIFDFSTTLDLGVVLDKDDEMRAFIRERLTDLFGEIWQVKPSVRFEGEDPPYEPTPPEESEVSQ